MVTSNLKIQIIPIKTRGREGAWALRAECLYLREEPKKSQTDPSLHFGSHVVLMTWALLCAALLLSAQCPVYCPSLLLSFMSLAMWIKFRHPVYSYLCSASITGQHSRVEQGWSACCVWAGRSKRMWLQCCQEPIGSKNLPVLREKQAGPTRDCYSLLYGTLQPVSKQEGNHVRA